MNHEPAPGLVAFVAALVLVSALLPGCGGATCERLAADRQAFLTRTATGGGPHLEVTVPYAVANALIAPALTKIDALEVELPGLGSLASAFGELAVRPRRVTLSPAKGDLVGLRLDFDVLVGRDEAFGLWLDTELRPAVDLAAGRAELGFSPESLKKVVPHLSPDAAERLGGIVYKRLPTLARAIVSRAAVDQAAGSAVEFLLKQFYALAKDKLLRQLSDRARLSIALPDVPIRTLSLGPTTEAGGGLRLAITTSLPIGAALGPREVRSQRLPADRVTLRASAATLAELVNWAMARGLVPSRYNDKGQADDQGEYLAAVEWIAGERPMKAHLWQLEGSCMRLDMGANARVGAKDGKVSIAAEDGVIEDVDAAPLTEVGVFFYALWKDAVNVTLDRSAELRFKVADQELVSRVEQATLTDDELTLIVTLQPADRAARIH